MDIDFILKDMFENFYGKRILKTRKGQLMTRVLKLHYLTNNMKSELDELIAESLEKDMENVKEKFKQNNEGKDREDNILERPDKNNKICKKFYYKLSKILHPDKDSGKKYHESLFNFLKDCYDRCLLYGIIVLLDYLGIEFKLTDVYANKIEKEIKWLNYKIMYYMKFRNTF